MAQRKGGEIKKKDVTPRPSRLIADDYPDLKDEIFGRLDRGTPCLIRDMDEDLWVFQLMPEQV